MGKYFITISPGSDKSSVIADIACGTDEVPETSRLGVRHTGQPPDLTMSEITKHTT